MPYRSLLHPQNDGKDFGQKRIDKVKISDAKLWLINLQKHGKGYSTIRTVRGILRPAFQMAVDDDINGIYILLNTGLRISEMTGLTKSDIDFKNMKINVDHQLQRYNGIGYRVVEPKTESGIREVPMTPEVAECFRRILQARSRPKVEPSVDGYAGFLFLDKDNRPMVAMHWEKYFQHICEKYNKIYKLQMPKVTPHVCRHTFCSRMAAARMNPKTLQYIMGHSDISVTLNTYTHLGFEEASKEIKRLAAGE